MVPASLYTIVSSVCVCVYVYVYLRIPRETTVRGGMRLKGAVVIIVASADETPAIDKGPDPSIVQ